MSTEEDILFLSIPLLKMMDMLPRQKGRTQTSTPLYRRPEKKEPPIISQGSQRN